MLEIFQFDRIGKERCEWRITMTMKSNILRDASGDIIIQMSGEINYEHSIPFRNQLLSLVGENPNTKIKVDIGGIDFVGSSGICHFVETLKLIDGQARDKLSLSNVRSEFVKVFRLYNIDDTSITLDYFDMDNDETYHLNTTHGNRSRTFEN